MHVDPVLIDGSPERRSHPAAPIGPLSTAPRGGAAHDLRLILPANARNVVLIRQAVTCLAEALDLPTKQIEDIRLAVTEACTNVVRHAYSSHHGDIEVQVTREADGALTVTVADHGCGLRPRTGDESSGLGIPLMGALAQALEIERRPEQGSRVRMCFQVADG